jgi:hypothetical protein
VAVGARSPGSLVVRLARGVTWRGEVRGPSDEPVADAVVRIEAGEHVARVRTDGAGRFASAALPAGEVLVQATHPTLGATEPLRFTLDAEHAGARLLRFQGGNTIVGQVRRDDGGAAVGVGVAARSSGASGAVFSARTDAEGRYALRGLPSGTAYIMVTERGGRTFFGGDAVGPHQAVVELAAAEERRVDLVLAASRSTLAGTVVDATGQPVEGATVSVRLAKAPPAAAPLAFAYTYADGSFTIEGLPDTGVRVSAAAPGWATVSVAARPGDPVRLVLPRGGGLRACATSGERGPGAVTFLVTPSPPDLARPPRLVAPAGPCLHEEHIEPGTYDVTARAIDGASARLAEVVVRDGEEASVQLALEPGARLRAQVSGASGAAIAGATVEIYAMRSVLAGTTDASGHVEIDGVPPGAWPISVRATGHEDDTRLVDFGGGDVAVVLTLE